MKRYRERMTESGEVRGEKRKTKGQGSERMVKNITFIRNRKEKIRGREACNALKNSSYSFRSYKQKIPICNGSREIFCLIKHQSICPCMVSKELEKNMTT